MSGVQANDVVRRIGLPNSYRIEAKSFSGGIWVLWKDSVDMVVEVNKFQFVHLRVKFPNLADWVFFSRIYGRSNGAKKRELWSNLRSIAYGIQDPLLLVGDFNAMLSDDEKK